MDFICNFPFFSIIVCLFSSVICSVLRGKAAKVLTLCVQFAVLCMSAAVLFYCLGTGEPFAYVMGHVGAPWGNELRAGVLEGLLATAFSAVILLSVLGGGRYIKRDITPQKKNLYYLLLNLLGAAVMALVYTNDIFTGYVFLEILTLASCGILMIRDLGRTTVAATRYLILNLLGSGLFLLGVILMYDITGHLLMENMYDAIQAIADNGEYSLTLTVTTGLMCVGLAIKSGLFPFHFWMPDTYGSATPSSAAILSGVVSKGYIFLLIKIMYRVIGVNNDAVVAVRGVLLVLGLIAIIYGSVSAIRQSSINKMIAFSSAAQIGYIYVGIGLGGTVGLCAAVFHILAHMVTKPLLFLSAARLTEVSGGSPIFRDLLGAAKRAPQAGIVFTIGSLSMVGFPVFAGFTSKLFFSFAAIESSGFFGGAALVVLAISTILNAYYFIRTVIRIYVPSGYSLSEHIKPQWALATAFICLIALNMSLGLCAEPIADVIVQGLEMLS